MRVAYCRVSTLEQNTARQEIAMKEVNVDTILYPLSSKSNFSCSRISACVIRSSPLKIDFQTILKEICSKNKADALYSTSFR